MEKASSITSLTSSWVVLRIMSSLGKALPGPLGALKQEDLFLMVCFYLCQYGRSK